ncbi:MAG: hypothetical protein M5U34_08525 [Chloroflexi bacterium]|nr:hypothetical protein [Chloroflexota bacterium]
MTPRQTDADSWTFGLRDRRGNGIQTIMRRKRARSLRLKLA